MVAPPEVESRTFASDPSRYLLSRVCQILLHSLYDPDHWQRRFLISVAHFICQRFRQPCNATFDVFSTEVVRSSACLTDFMLVMEHSIVT